MFEAAGFERVATRQAPGAQRPRHRAMTDGGNRGHHRQQRYPAVSPPDGPCPLRSRGRVNRPGGVGFVLALALIAACGAGLPEPIRDWPVVDATLDGQRLRLVVAVDRQQGMQRIAELTGADGMLFDFGREVDPASARFWMRDVAIPLDIAWFDAGGRLVGTAAMPTCDLDCPRYEAPGAFRFAVETPAGSLPLQEGSVLELTD